MKKTLLAAAAALLFIFLISLASFAASGEPSPGPLEAGTLHVEGTQLLSQDGKPLRLCGISTHGLQWYPQYVNGDTFRELRDNWNINVIRLALYTEESGWCAQGAAEKDRLRNILHRGIRLAAENDLYVILDWHILSDGDPNQHLAEAKAFFQEFSHEYKDSSHILYEICNEPNGGVSWARIKQYAEAVIPVIRGNDPDAVILVGTPTWSQDIDQALADPITGYGNVMYTFHFYAATHKQELRSRLQKTVDLGLPVFVSECGLCSADGNGSIDRESAAAWLELLEQNGISTVFWNLSNKNEASALLSPSCSGLSGFSAADLSESGKLIQEYLTSKHAVAGTVSHSSKPVATGPASSSYEAGTAKPTGTAEPTEAGNAGQNETAASEQKTTIPGGSVTASVSLRTSWPEGSRHAELYDVSVTATGSAVSGWSIDLPVPADAALRDSWGGTFTLNNGILRIRSLDYNAALKAGETAGNIGFILIKNE
ncbi:MAG: cellulase family glycosylhydrolase [Stomatobaculum sp.]|nr:cellulase family glycosylhydrolase [Stomatobaculum sp.]